MADTKKKGNRGEEIAHSFLIQRGFTILERNFRILRGELDIIANDGDTLVFVEVKCGNSQKYGPPETWVTRRKQQQIGRLALAYLQKFNIVNKNCRFDVIAITFDKGHPEIKHIKNAFWL